MPDDPTADLFDEIHEWQLATFPNACALSKFEHLKREIAELGEDITKPSEIADCMLLLIGLAKIQGINPIAAMREKLAVNKSRKWGEPDALGVVEHVREPDDADEHEAEFLSRLPRADIEHDDKNRVDFVGKEPETVPSAPAPSNDQQIEPKGKGGRTYEPDDVRAARLWQQYRDRRPDATPNAIVALVRGHMPKFSTAEVRELIRSTGIDIPEPDTRAQCAANARHAREAAARASAQEPPKVEAPKRAIEDVNVPMPLAGVGPEATVQLIHVLTRSVRRRWPEDRDSVRAHIVDMGPLTQLRKVSDAAIALFDSMNRAWLDAYSDLPPFKQRDVDSALLAGWKKVAA